jgi:hypothetical protein
VSRELVQLAPAASNGETPLRNTYYSKQLEISKRRRRDAWTSRLGHSTSKISLRASSARRLKISLWYLRHERWNGMERKMDGRYSIQ